jgi:hypothetical protein
MDGKDDFINEYIKETQQDYTNLYIKELKRRFPHIEIASTVPLEIVTSLPDEEEEVKLYLHNSYKEYVGAPERLNEIMERYMKPLDDIYTQNNDFVVTVDNIFPIIRNKKYLSQLEALSKKAVYEPYNSELFIFYVIDKGHSTQSLSLSNFESLEISIDKLREVAVANLLHNIKIEAVSNGNLTYLSVDDYYESSLILVEDIWTKENFSVQGDIVIAIPSYGTLFVTGSEYTKGLEILDKNIQEVFKQNMHLISDKKFVFRNEKFEVFL